MLKKPDTGSAISKATYIYNHTNCKLKKFHKNGQNSQQTICIFDRRLITFASFYTMTGSPVTLMFLIRYHYYPSGSLLSPLSRIPEMAIYKISCDERLLLTLTDQMSEQRTNSKKSGYQRIGIKIMVHDFDQLFLFIMMIVNSLY